MYTKVIMKKIIFKKNINENADSGQNEVKMTNFKKDTKKDRIVVRDKSKSNEMG